MDEVEQGMISRCLAGEAAAFEQLYEAHGGRVKAHFLRCGFKPADADDLTQDTFVRVFKSLTTFDAARGSLGQWVGAIARNVARRRWDRRVQPDNFDPELADEMFAADDNPGLCPETAEELAALRQCLTRLPAELACLVRLRYVEGRTTRGIAAVAGMAEATVRLRLQEAMGLLRQGLRAQGVCD